MDATSLSHWIALGVTVIGFAVTLSVAWGSAITRVRINEEALKALSKGREAQGIRIGILEERVANLEGRLGWGIDGRRHRPTDEG